VSISDVCACSCFTRRNHINCLYGYITNPGTVNNHLLNTRQLCRSAQRFMERRIPMNMNSNGDLRSTLTRRQMIGTTASALAVLGISSSLAAQTRASATTDSRNITELQRGASEMTQSQSTRSIIDTHRHIFGPRLRQKFVENIGFDDKKPLPQANAGVFLSRVGRR
jgi:hypothetical protein